MPDWLSIHEPVLVNTIGHCAGAVLFGMLLYFFLLNWRHDREERTKLPALAAALAFLWNIGSLVALGVGRQGGSAADVIVAASFSVLSLLPAVLLHISLGSHHRLLWISGYVLSFGGNRASRGGPDYAFVPAPFRGAGAGDSGVCSSDRDFGVFLEIRNKNGAATSRLAGAMVLFLFAISFAHFSSEQAHQAWSKEIALHHAGIPLALFVLLQNYRFLLLDAFLRFVVNATLAAAAVLASIRIVESAHFGPRLDASFRRRAAVCGRVPAADPVRLCSQSRAELADPGDFLAFQCRRRAGRTSQAGRGRRGTKASIFLGGGSDCGVRAGRALRFGRWRSARRRRGLAWVQAVVPLRFSRGDARYLLLGPRDGARRYLSEDFAVLMRLGAAVVEHVEQLRGIQMQGLVSQAELKALQAQINPHFLFNSLNTLYGTIDRGNAEARRLVLNLADVFRYLLRSDRTLIEIEEELRIVRAYLEIEQLRLGAKLRTEINVDEAALRATIPLLSVQPLVENAVKHGVAPRTGTGFVRLDITSRAGHAYGDRFQLRRMRLGRSHRRRRRRRNRLWPMCAAGWSCVTAKNPVFWRK